MGGRREAKIKYGPLKTCGFHSLPRTDWSFEHGTTHSFLVTDPGSAAKTLTGKPCGYGPRQTPKPLPTPRPPTELMPSRKRYKFRVEYWPGKLEDRE